MTIKPLPKFVIAGLNASSGFSRCYVNNDKVNNWLTDKLSLVTDDNEHDLGQGYIVDFCWLTQRWYVK